jgi:hypothetical protein
MAADLPPEPLRLPSPLNRLPWDIAQSEFVRFRLASFKPIKRVCIWLASKNSTKCAHAYLATGTGLFVGERPACCRRSPMHDCMACIAKRNQVLLCIIAGLATEFPMVNLEMRQRAATLAPPSVAA